MVGAGASLAHGAQLAVLRWLQGRPGDVRAILEDLAQEPFGRGWRTLFPLWHAGLGWEGEARRSLDAAAAEGFAGQRSGVEVVGLVDACTLLGDADAAARLYASCCCPTRTGTSQPDVPPTLRRQPPPRDAGRDRGTLAGRRAAPAGGHGGVAGTAATTITGRGVRRGGARHRGAPPRFHPT
jgi:hypothetical protein